MRPRPVGRFAVPGLLAAALFLAACASGGSRAYRDLLITGDQIREDGYATAFEALTHHRELIVMEDRIGFEGGDDQTTFGRERREYTIPLLVVNGNWNMNDPITTLRQIPATEIILIRLYYRSMVPPEYRRPGFQGGLIEVRTR